MSFNITEVNTCCLGHAVLLILHYSNTFWEPNFMILLVSTEVSKDLILSHDMHHKPYPYLVLKVSHNPSILPNVVNDLS
jgi:hypothetical protein